MKTIYSTRHCLCLLAFLCTLLFAVSCGGRSNRSSTLPPQLASPSDSIQQRSRGKEDVSRALADIAALPLPAGVDPLIWQQLKDSLTAELQQRVDRQSSGLADASRNQVSDAEIVADGEGSWNVTWTYRNLGDFDLNGEVNGADIAPIAKYFRAGTQSSNWDAAQAADGDANGEVNAADIVPIAANFFSQVLGYKIYGGNSEGGPWVQLLGTAAISEATSGFPPAFTFALGATPPPFILLSAYDATGADWQGGVDPVPAQFVAGLVQPGADAAIGQAGGTLDGPSGSPLEGVKVVVPAGAIPNGTQVTLDYNDGSVTPAAGVWEGPIIELEVDQPNAEFDEPIYITLPYSESADFIPVPYYIDDQGRFEGCDLKSIDAVNGTYTFTTWHASKFTTIKVAKGSVDLEDYDTRFKPEDNGFQVINATSAFTGGNCGGLSAFAAWYYTNWKGIEPPLYNSFMYNVDARKGQDVVGTRAAISMNRKWTEHWPYVDAQSSLDDEEVFNIIRNMMTNQGSPVLLYIKAATPKGRDAVHAIMAYAYDEDSLKVWDPNTPAPQATPEVTFDEITGFNPFNNGGYNFISFKYLGLGSVKVAENFYDILQDAKNQFQSVDSTITSIAPADGHTTASLTQLLNFTVSSGQVNVEHVELLIKHVGDDTFARLKAAPGASDDYAFNVPLKPGDNVVWFDTQGYGADNALISTRNNWRTKDFHIECNAPSPQFRLELTWKSWVPGGPLGNFVLCVKEEPDDGSGPHILDGHNGNATSPTGLQLVTTGPPDGETGGTQTLIVPDTVEGRRQLSWCVHRTDTDPDASVRWEVRTYWNDDTEGNLLNASGGRHSLGDGNNTPNWQVIGPSPAWSTTRTYGL